MNTEHMFGYLSSFA